MNMTGESSATPPVLNAFRHHWNLHYAAGKACGRGKRCSTPFGIIGIFTLESECIAFRLNLVLNAFRHHWNLHIAAAVVARREFQCSTPFGIIGIFTWLLSEAKS